MEIKTLIVLLFFAAAVLYMMISKLDLRFSIEVGNRVQDLPTHYPNDDVHRPTVIEDKRNARHLLEG